MSLIASQAQSGKPVSALVGQEGVTVDEATYTYREYHDFTQSVLCSAGLMLQRAPQNDRRLYAPDRFKGRGGSALFEKEFVKSTLLHPLQSATLTQTIRRSTSGQSLRFLRFEDPERGLLHNEAATRAWADLFIIASYGHNEISIPVNIKYTGGSSADNLCGWDAIDFVLYKDSSRKSGKTAFFDKLIAEGIPEDEAPRDYFFWSFQYDENSQYLFSKISTYSLLSIPVELLQFNPSQSFPVQLATNKLDQIENIPLLFNVPTQSLRDMKKTLLGWLLEKRIADDIKTSQQNLAAYAALNR
jgi:hypothetical protein